MFSLSTNILHNNDYGSDGIRTHASEETGALNQRLRPLGHATVKQFGFIFFCTSGELNKLTCRSWNFSSNCLSTVSIIDNLLTPRCRWSDSNGKKEIQRQLPHIYYCLLWELNSWPLVTFIHYPITRLVLCHWAKKAVKQLKTINHVSIYCYCLAVFS